MGLNKAGNQLEQGISLNNQISVVAEGKPTERNENLMLECPLVVTSSMTNLTYAEVT